MKILIIDDENLVRRSLGRVLTGRGHEVREAADGLAGLESWQSFDPDLVFLDVLMPGLTGPQVLEKVGPSRRARVVVMTAFAGEQNVGVIAGSSIDLFLAKPFEDIFEVVQKAERLFD